jgi:acyl-CoA thioester hydrolase
MDRPVNIEYRVPYADTDQMAVVYYANFFVYFERVRNEVLRKLGLTYRQMEADGLMLPVIEATCAYHSPAHYDDLLTLGGHFEPVSTTRLRAVCTVHRGEDLLASGHTIHVCLGVETRRPTRLPAILRGTA